jgi:DNA-binding NarL/FixJ family response regulator
MIRVLLADDHALMRAGLRQVIESATGLAVAVEAADGNAVLRALREVTCDLAVLDLSMPGISGIALIRQVRRLYPELPVLVVSMYIESQYAVQALRAGANGYLGKNATPAEFIEGIRQVARGGTCVSPAIAAKLVRELHARTGDAPHARLTPREFEIFRMLAAGQTVGAIADALSLSSKTVSTHKANLLDKLGLTSTAALVLYAQRHGLLEQDTAGFASFADGAESSIATALP